ncbi:glycosyltransferase family protein [Spirosoma luteum]|uniref:glycosyltransferase family protein n=1 Tax=Spirosoma luteum TaxID=431553 RepID=UPI00037CC349
MYQRPQHVLSRASEQWPVWFIEEPIWGPTLRLDIRPVTDQIQVVVPHLPEGIDPETAVRLQRQLVNQLLEQKGITDFMAWYYTPMAMLFTDHLRPRLTLYDCMDELSAFKGASPLLLQQEKNLLSRAQVVFTGGYSLYEAKQLRHEQVFAFPSCIEYPHFAQARQGLPDPADQRHLTGPRIGYSGVIDERLDLDLLRELAGQLPDWQFILLGPVVKIDPTTLPQGPNVHYLGLKDYADLPAYFSNWDAALMPFAINEATRYISPTKTPEYLAAGLPVLSTPIRDVVRTYGGWDQVAIADSAAGLEKALARLIRYAHKSDRTALDAFLQEQSWDHTWQQMHRLLIGQLTYAPEKQAY